jgi:hypothetical protein
MSKKREGTCVLDGILEGRVPHMPGSAEKMREWVRFAQSANLHFSLEIDGDSFSILADNTPVETADLAPSPADRMVKAIEQLLKVFPPEERKRLSSTLRSVEYMSGQELQSLYTVSPLGEVEVHSRTAQAETATAEPKLTRREKTYVALFGAVLALLILGITGLVFKNQIADIVNDLVPVDLTKLVIETGSFQPYLTVENKKLEQGSRALDIAITRTAAFPSDNSAIEQALKAPGLSFADRLTLEALARGYIRCEYFGKDGKYLGTAEIRVTPLRENQSLTVVIPYSRTDRPSRIIFTY